MAVIIVLRSEADRSAWAHRAEVEGMDLKEFEALPLIFEVNNRKATDFAGYSEIESVEDSGDLLHSALAQPLNFATGWQNAHWGLARHTRRDPPWGKAGIRLPLASTFECTRTGDGVDIYVVDTGVEVAHPEFNGRAAIVYEYMPTGGIGDDDSHGTFCASCAAGSTIGFARNALIWSCKIFGTENSGTIANIITGLNAAVSHYNGRAATDRPAVMSLSIQGESNGFASAVMAAMSAGIVVVAAAGNFTLNLDLPTSNSFPAETGGVIAVGAIMPNDGPTSFTNYGTRIDLLAAGEFIYGANLRSKGSDYKMWQGTSFSCPATAGAIACVLQGYRRLTTFEQTQHVRSYMKDQATWDRYIPDLGHTPMTPAILYLEPSAVYPEVPGLVRK